MTARRKVVRFGFPEVWHRQLLIADKTGAVSIL